MGRIRPEKFTESHRKGQVLKWEEPENMPTSALSTHEAITWGRSNWHRSIFRADGHTCPKQESAISFSSDCVIALRLATWRRSHSPRSRRAIDSRYIVSGENASLSSFS